jgi:hypothetical protein
MSAAQRVALIPGPLALRSKYASIDDPLPQLRVAVEAAVRWLADGAGPTGEIGVHCTSQQRALASELLAPYGRNVATCSDSPPAVLAIANGSACRSEKAPGSYDPRAADFDARLEAALRVPDVSVLRSLDEGTAVALLADVEAIRWIGHEVLTDQHRCHVDYSADPYGVQYWVMRWELFDAG